MSTSILIPACITGGVAIAIALIGHRNKSRPRRPVVFAKHAGDFLGCDSVKCTVNNERNLRTGCRAKIEEIHLTGKEGIVLLRHPLAGTVGFIDSDFKPVISPSDFWIDAGKEESFSIILSRNSRIRIASERIIIITSCSSQSVRTKRKVWKVATMITPMSSQNRQ
jgi:hypothetical protein